MAKILDNQITIGSVLWLYYVNLDPLVHSIQGETALYLHAGVLYQNTFRLDCVALLYSVFLYYYCVIYFLYFADNSYIIMCHNAT